MRKIFILAAALALPLASCATDQTGPATPSSVANKTVLDEKGAIGVELGYTAAAKAAALAIRTGLVKDPATIKKIGEADSTAYAAVQATRAAYEAGNATSYEAAFEKAKAAVSGILAAF